MKRKRINLEQATTILHETKARVDSNELDPLGACAVMLQLFTLSTPTDPLPGTPLTAGGGRASPIGVRGLRRGRRRREAEDAAAMMTPVAIGGEEEAKTFMAGEE